MCVCECVSECVCLCVCVDVCMRVCIVWLCFQVLQTMTIPPITSAERIYMYIHNIHLFIRACVRLCVCVGACVCMCMYACVYCLVVLTGARC